MCPWVGPHAPSFGRQLWGLPSRVEYLSPEGILLPRVYGTAASPLWLELRGHAAWHATPSWTVYRLACHRLLPWPRVTFAMVRDATWPGSDEGPWGTAPGAGPVGRLGRPGALDPWGVVSCCPSLGRARHARVCGVLGHLAPVRRCARSSCCFARAVSFGHLAPVHRCARFVCCVACAVSTANWLLCTGVRARCALLRVRCPGPLSSWSPLCPLPALCCVCGVLGHLAPVHRCARSERCPACAFCWATWLPFRGVPARCAALGVWCPAPLGLYSPVRSLGALCGVCGILGHLAPVHRCARSVRCVACAVSRATWLLFTAVLARHVVLSVRCPGPFGSCSPVCPLGAWRCMCAVSWATGLPFTVVLARYVMLRVRWPRPLGSCSPVCSLGALCCVCGILGHLAPVHRCARSVCCVACAVCWATWLLFIGLPARCAVLRVCGVLGHLAPVQRCACSV